MISPGVVATFARLYLQTLGLSMAFIGTGQFIHGALLTRDEPNARRAFPGANLDWGSSYFLGLSAFLLTFVFVSRLSGARAALWIGLLGMAVVSVPAFRRMPETADAWRRIGRLLVALLSLVAFYSVTNAALWLTRQPSSPIVEPGVFSHFGSIHAGRYANYAILIAQSDRVPRLAQNMGQSILASLHLLLGADSPLAALMVWVPFSLAFLTLLIFNLFRTVPLTRGRSLAATFLVMYCNVAVSLVHVLVFDNGSPLAFIGYSDMIIAIATFMILCRWWTAELALEHPGPPWRVLLPVLLTTTWCWYAPQNIVLAAPALVATALVWSWRFPSHQLRRRLRTVGMAMLLSVCAGATQLGTLLPGLLREETGLWTQSVEASSVAIRPYTVYLRGEWSERHWNVDFPTGDMVSRLYERAFEQGSRSFDEVFRRWSWLLEEQLWESIRAYGFPLIGLCWLGTYLWRQPPSREQHLASRAWWLLSVFSFGCGYLICFGLEVGQMKWWLTRFLVPGSAMTLTCLGIGALGCFGDVPLVTRRILWSLLIACATVGPLTELAAVAGRNFLPRSADADPLARRLTLLAQAKGPFVFQTLIVRDDVAASTLDRSGETHFLVGGKGRQQGLAIYTPPIFMKAGAHRVGYQVNPTQRLLPESDLLFLDVTVDRGTSVVAGRPLHPGDLDRRADGDWAWLDFTLSKDASDAQFRLWNRSATAFEVGAIRFDRR